MNFYRYSRHPWAAMSHLTPSELDVLLKPNFGIRQMSDAIARDVSFAEIFQGLGIYHSSRSGFDLVIFGSEQLTLLGLVYRSKCSF